MRLKADFHLHTSEDGYDRIRYHALTLIDRLAAHGFEVASITNHSIFLFCDYLVQYAADKGIVLIPGIEALLKKRHVIILNCDKDAEKIKTFADLRAYREDHPECFVVAPHPFYPRSSCLRHDLLENPELFDGIEYCHFYTFLLNFYNYKAQRVAKKLKKPLIGTSDAHCLNHLNTTYSIVDAPEKNVKSIINALKAGNVKVETQPIHPFRFIQRSMFYTFKSKVYGKKAEPGD